MNTDLTVARVVVLAVLRNGPATWKDLRVAYYGPVRSTNPSSTSFHNQLGRMTVKGLITKSDGHYEITPLGRELIEKLTPEEIASAKSKAQTMAEVK